MHSNIEANQGKELLKASEEGDFSKVQMLLAVAGNEQVIIPIETIATLLFSFLNAQDEIAVLAVLKYLRQLPVNADFIKRVFSQKNAANLTPLLAAISIPNWSIAKQFILYIGELLDNDDSVGYETALYHSAVSAKAEIIQLLFFFRAPVRIICSNFSEIQNITIQNYVLRMLNERDLFLLLQQLEIIRNLEAGIQHIEKIDCIINAKRLKIEHLNEWPHKPTEVILSLYDAGKSVTLIEKILLKKLLMVFVQRSQQLSKIIDMDDNWIGYAIRSQHWYPFQVLCRCSEIAIQQRRQLLVRINQQMTHLGMQQSFIENFGYDILTLRDKFSTPFISPAQNRTALLFYCLDQFEKEIDDVEEVIEVIASQLAAGVLADVVNEEGKTPLALIAGWSPILLPKRVSEREIVIRKLVTLFIENGASVSALYAPMIIDNPIQIAIKNENWYFLQAFYDCDVMIYQQKRNLFKAIHQLLLVLTRFQVKVEPLEQLYFPAYALARAISDSKSDNSFIWRECLEPGSPFLPISGSRHLETWVIHCPENRIKNLCHLLLSQLEWGEMHVHDEIIVKHDFPFNITSRLTIHQFLLAYIADKNDFGIFITYFKILNRLYCYAEINGGLNEAIDKNIWKKFLCFIKEDIQGFRGYFLLTIAPPNFLQPQDFQLLTSAKEPILQWLKQLNPNSITTLNILWHAINPDHPLGQLFATKSLKPFLPQNQRPENYIRQITAQINLVEENLRQVGNKRI